MNIYTHPYICVERDDNGKIVFEKVEKKKKIQDTVSWDLRSHVTHHFTFINIFRNYEILFIFFFLLGNLICSCKKNLLHDHHSSKIYIYINLKYDDIKYPKKNFIIK